MMFAVLEWESSMCADKGVLTVGLLSSWNSITSHPLPRPPSLPSNAHSPTQFADGAWDVLSCCLCCCFGVHWISVFAGNTSELLLHCRLKQVVIWQKRVAMCKIITMIQMVSDLKKAGLSGEPASKHVTQPDKKKKKKILNIIKV